MKGIEYYVLQGSQIMPRFALKTELSIKMYYRL